MNAISLLLMDLQVKLGLKEQFRFPMGISGDVNMYLKKRLVDKKELADNKDPVFKFFEISYARQYLTCNSYCSNKHGLTCGMGIYNIGKI
jgi:hypothetical protein